MNRQNAVNIEDLQEELWRIRITVNNIERILQTVRNQDRQDRGEDLWVNPADRRGPDYPHNHPRVLDSEGTEILIGDTVNFLTRGLFTSTSGVVYKVSQSGNRVTSRDSFRRAISRASHNLRVQYKE